MGFWNDLFGVEVIDDSQRERSDSRRVTSGERVVPTGRVTLDASSKIPFQLFIRQEKDQNRDVKYIELKLDKIGKMQAKELYQILIDSDPEVSLALYHWLSFCNVDHKFYAYNPGTDTEHTEAQAVIDQFLMNLEHYYGGFDILLSRIFYSIFYGGASFKEIVLDESGREMLDFIVISPYEAKFEKKDDPLRGPVWDLGQIKNGKFESLSEYETVVYMPFHPAPNNPYGRPLMSPTVFASLFLVSILRDLERVIRHQGWERLDIQLNASEMDIDVPEGKTEAEVIRGMIQQIDEDYKKLEADDVFIHTDHWEFKNAVGISGRFAFQGISDIIQILERRIIRGLKSQPLLMGSNEAVTETHANRQWEVYSGGVRAVQGLVGRSIQRLFEVGLQASGILADVRLLFGEFRDSERLRDLQADQQELLNLQIQKEEEWVEDDEATDIARQIRQGRRRNLL